MRVLLTGASGFVGSHLLRHILTEEPAAEIVAPVTFRHHGVPRRIELVLADLPDATKRCTFPMLDLAAPVDRVTRTLLGDVDVIMNVASDSGVDRSISDPGACIRNNVDLMVNVLEYARIVKPRIVLQMSTDEVYGPAFGEHRHAEWEAIRPSNPYSASKAAQEAIAHSYWRTYSVPVVITNTMNIFGSTQDPEKMVPMTIARLHRGERVPVFTDPAGSKGSRYYLHADNLASAWLHLARHHAPQSYASGYTEPSRYHIVGDQEVENHEVVELIADIMGVEPLIDRVSFHQTRPGHDLRYALDGAKLAATGWSAPTAFLPSLERTVRWTLAHPEWLAE